MTTPIDHTDNAGTEPAGTEPVGTEPVAAAAAAAAVDPDDLGRSGVRGERAEIGKPYVRWSRLSILVALLAAVGIWQGWRTLLLIGAVIVMIFFHELGHFVMARRADMKVTEFMIGFGPRIASFRRGDVEYGLKAIPAGAYVKIIGMANIEEVAPGDEDRTYRQKGYWQRMGVAVAGSAMHFIMALLLIGSSLVFIGLGDPSNWMVDNISPGSAAERAGVQLGDKVVEFGGVSVDSWAAMSAEARANPDRRVEVVVERDGENIPLEVQVTSRFAVVGLNGNEFQVFSGEEGEPIVSVRPLSGPASAGIVDGARITSVNGRPVEKSADVVAALEDETLVPTTEVTFGQVDAQGAASESTVNFGSRVGVTKQVGFFGVGEERTIVKYSPIAAVPKSFEWFGEVAKASVVGVWNFFRPSNVWGFVERVFTTTPSGESTRDEPAPNRTQAERTMEDDANRMVSIVGAVGLGSQLTEDGLGPLLQFLALLNMAIGIFNLIPLPPFDGGHVLIGTYEKIRELLRRDGRRYLADYAKIMPVATGVVIIMAAIGLMAIYLDIADPVQI